MSRLQKGFTLVELMITLTIIGVLAAIAIPSYTNYTIRARLVEAIAATAPCKAMITEGLLTRASLPDDWNQWGCETQVPGTVSKYVAAIVADKYGGIGVLVWGFNDPTIDLHWITLTPLDGTMTRTPALGTAPSAWVCGNQYQVGDSYVGRTVPVQYLPSTCRG